MATQPQIDANRRNAQRSTGPKTPEGRAAVRLNSVRHGLTAAAIVLPGESEEDFTALLDSIELEHQPGTPTEAALVRRIAMAAWRLTRSYHVEAGYFAAVRLDLADHLKPYNRLGPHGALGAIAISDAQNSNVLENMSRYEGRLERSLDKALRELDRLRSTRSGEMKKQSQFGFTQPQPNAVPEIVNGPATGPSDTT